MEKQANLTYPVYSDVAGFVFDLTDCASLAGAKSPYHRLDLRNQDASVLSHAYSRAGQIWTSVPSTKPGYYKTYAKINSQIIYHDSAADDRSVGVAPLIQNPEASTFDATHLKNKYQAYLTLGQRVPLYPQNLVTERVSDQLNRADQKHLLRAVGEYHLPAADQDPQAHTCYYYHGGYFVNYPDAQKNHWLRCEPIPVTRRLDGSLQVCTVLWPATYAAGQAMMSTFVTDLLSSLTFEQQVPRQKLFQNNLALSTKQLKMPATKHHKINRQLFLSHIHLMEQTKE